MLVPAAFGLRFVATTPPKRTALAPRRLLPPMVTTVPPAVGPDVGLIDVTTGRSTYAKRSSVDDPHPEDSTTGEIPTSVVTLTWTLPVPGGATARICVGDSTV